MDNKDAFGPEPDWGGRLPETALFELATSCLRISDIKRASQVCKRWRVSLRFYRKKVTLLPTARGVAQSYPPQLFSRQDTVCVLPFSPEKLSTSKAHDNLAAFGSILAAYRLPNLHVVYTVDESNATGAYAEGVHMEQQRRQEPQAPGAVRLPAPALSNPYQPYHDLSTSLIHSLNSFLRSASNPGQHLRRLTLEVVAMPAPEALVPLSQLPALDSLELLGGRAAFLQLAHLRALEALRGLTALSLEGVWCMQRPGGPVGNHQALMGAAQPAVQPAEWPADGDNAGDDAGGMELDPWIDPVAPPVGAGGNQAIAGGAVAAAAAAVANAPGPRPGPDNGRNEGEEPWPPTFTALEHLRVLRLRNYPHTLRSIIPWGSSALLKLDLYPLTELRELEVRGELDPQLSRLRALQHLTRLRTHHTLSAADWEAMRAMEGLAEVDLQADVAGRIRGLVALRGDIHVQQHGSDRQLKFRRPPWMDRGDGDHGSGSGAESGSAAGSEPTALGGAVAAAAEGNLFAAAAAAAAARAARIAAAPRVDRLRTLAELFIKLEPLRFLSDATSLTRLNLSWRPLRGDGGDDGDDGPPPPVTAPRRWTLDEALFARAPHISCLKALSELQDVELHSPGGELVLDGALLEALAPTWRRLRRFVFSGLLMPSAAGPLSLPTFAGLKELGLHDVASRRGALGDEPRPKLQLPAAALPAGLERLSLTNINVLHVPGACLRGLQRLDLREGCDWRAGDGTAPATAAAAYDPWLLRGLPLLTHLRLQPTPLDPSQLRSALAGCGTGLRSLSLVIPGDQSNVGALRCTLTQWAHLLPKLAHLNVQVQEPPPQPGTFGMPVPFHGMAGAEAADGMWPGFAPGMVPMPIGPMPPAARGAASARTSLLKRRLEAKLKPIDALVSALLAMAAEPPAGTGALPELRQLHLKLPCCAQGELLFPRPEGDRAELQQLLRTVMADCLERLGQLSRLEELFLVGPLMVVAGQALERRLLQRLPHCHIQIRP